ncbi:hypothetical protein [Brevibacillus sp. MCWH]|mgnify:FL=1|jgi:hypothetical protein|uniref:hypothetical protein n=1 Tax=Brevibacillus sp. MCWH TaxID=2508871 RepID=UPI0014927C17|nr:hypothetical protein [Brevibacillus sp. MCWH]NNV01579.1 hypothetical protein [Brevibacillus sp. MCWH]
MKKIGTKPVLAVVTAAAIIGGVTPLLADASTPVPATNSTKVVMNDESKHVTRYNLKELAANDPATLNMLLKTQADHLYLVVKEIGLDAKLRTYIEEHPEEWERVYREHYADIYLEVRFDVDEQGFISVKPETRDTITYLKGKVSEHVTKVVVEKPNGGTIEVIPTAEDTFTVSFTAIVSATPQYATVKAYVDDKLVDTRKVQVNTGTVVQADVLIHTLALLDEKKQELKVNGIISQEADKVVVTYNGKSKEANVKKLWQGVGSFSVSLKDVQAGKGKVLIAAYKDGKKIDSESVELKVINDADKPHSYRIEGTATINAKEKQVRVKGSIDGLNGKGKVKLYVVAPDGKKHEVKVKDGRFEAKLKYHDRSYSAKAVHLELYLDGKLVAKADIPHNKPVNGDDDEKGKDKGKDKDKGPKGNGNGKKHGDDDDHK